jgi:hypothetical protein
VRVRVRVRVRVCACACVMSVSVCQRRLFFSGMRPHLVRENNNSPTLPTLGPSHRHLKLKDTVRGFVKA